jgi:hypothetical protein
MAKVVSEKKYSSFVKGLITEASALTFPENASLSEVNFDLHRDGSRSRRLGLDYEDSYALTSTGFTSTILSGTRTSVHRWDFPGGSSDVAIGVVRVYNKLWFINLLAASPSAALLNGGVAITIPGLLNNDINVAVLNNYFVFVSKDLNLPVILDYNSDTDTVTQFLVPLYIRDTFGVEDGHANNLRPTTLTQRHKYNLLNQGWDSVIPTICSTPAIPGYYEYAPLDEDSLDGLVYVAPIPATTIGCLDCTFTTLGVYPSNADIWSLGKVGDTTSADHEKYSPTILQKNSIDNFAAAKGHYIIDIFNRGTARETLSACTNLSLDQETGNVTAIASYAGRIFYSGISSKVTEKDRSSPNFSGFIFFSQLASAKEKFGRCYQEADPTSPEISDIVDTDGGTIHIPEASHIVALVPVKDSLMVFAENGIWEIYGDTGGFKATNYQIAFVSSMGISNPKSIVVSGDKVVYWAKAGIFGLSPSDITGRYTSNSLSLNTIQTLYDEISDVARNNARGFFDERENHIRWIYNDSAVYDGTTYVNKYDTQLNLDLGLGAFYKYTIGELAANSPYVSDIFRVPSYALTDSNVDIYSGSDNVLSVTDQVEIPVGVYNPRIGTYMYLTFSGTSFTLSKYNNTEFLDWKIADTIGVDAPAYLITGYELFNDIMRNKEIPYIFFYLTRTEDGFTSDGSNNYTANNPSSCMVQAQWNWSNSDAQGKWGIPFQAYRYLRSYVPSGISDTYDTGDSIIVTKNKLRGSGRAVSLKIYTEPGKDLHLLGWAHIVTGEGTP